MSGYFCFATQQSTPRLPLVSEALDEPNGLLATGGDLQIPSLLAAYKQGIFPWFAPGQPILWWSPDPRAVLYPERLHIARRLQQYRRQMKWRVSVDEHFVDVIHACAAPRGAHAGTWLTHDMIDAYCALHTAGHAHSIECWDDETLAGGVYGVAVGQVFFAESMFSRATNGSKMALIALCEYLQAWEYQLIDCQFMTPHLATLGVELISRREFCNVLHIACAVDPSSHAWQRE